MRVKNSTPAWANKARCDYYRLRAEKLERINREEAARYMPAAELSKSVRAFCEVIGTRIARSRLPTELKSELKEDIADFLKRSKGGSNGNGQKPKSNRGRPKRRK
jgi:hypothetical protein